MLLHSRRDSMFTDRSAPVALCPQSDGLGSALVPNLSVYNNVFMGKLSQRSNLMNLANLIIPLKKEKVKIHNLLKTLNLEDKIDTSVDSLSGGQRQRIGIARALYQEKNIFIGDEPVSSLDPLQGLKLLGILAQQHHTMVIATHSPKLAISCFNRIIGLKGGGIYLDCHTSDINESELTRLFDS